MFIPLSKSNEKTPKTYTKNGHIKQRKLFVASFPALSLDIARYAFGKEQKNLPGINQKSSQSLLTDLGSKLLLNPLQPYPPFRPTTERTPSSLTLLSVVGRC